MVCTELAGPPWPTFPARIDLAALAHLKLKDRWKVRYEQLREAPHKVKQA